jgi:aldose 1-epimerase
MTIEKELFGTLSDGSQAFLFTMKHPTGSLAQFTNYGGALVALKVPDKKGLIEDVVLGFDTLADYERIRDFYGAIVGRYGNRISRGKFRLNGKEYVLAKNEGNNHLHGGQKGFDRVLWDIIDYGSEDNKAYLKLYYLSKDGEEGYPGNLQVVVTYSYNRNDELRIDYSLTTDKITVSNVTSHGYFNLCGDLGNDILDHQLIINGDNYLPVVKGLIPTGEMHTITSTPMDFKTFAPIGARINQNDPQLILGLGYDHNWVLNGSIGALKQAATVFEPLSGRIMEVLTTEPGIQFYSGNFLDGSHLGHNHRRYSYRSAFCLETQHFPDSPNHDNFPSTVIKPGETYTSTTIYKFGVK